MQWNRVSAQQCTVKSFYRQLWPLRVRSVCIRQVFHLFFLYEYTAKLKGRGLGRCLPLPRENNILRRHEKFVQFLSLVGSVYKPPSRAWASEPPAEIPQATAQLPDELLSVYRCLQFNFLLISTSVSIFPMSNLTPTTILTPVQTYSCKLRRNHLLISY